jgi:hypothetical protein
MEAEANVDPDRLPAKSTLAVPDRKPFLPRLALADQKTSGQRPRWQGQQRGRRAEDRK